MILQALTDYFNRAEDLAPPGWERKRIPFIIEIARDGRFVQLTSMRVGSESKDVVEQLVPRSEIRPGTKSYEKPNLLWDHIGFALGHPKSDADKDVRAAQLQLNHFRRRIEAFSASVPASTGLDAIRLFYQTEEYLRVSTDPAWKECIAIQGCNVTFRLAESAVILIHEPEIHAAIDGSTSESNEVCVEGVCLVTGSTERIERLHPPISNVGKKPAPLAAINDGSLPSFASFGKHQGENFPVGATAAFKYATALNHLLRNGSTQKLRIGDSIAVFWAQREGEPLEPWLAELIGGDDPDAHTTQVKVLFEAVHTGALDGERGQNLFFVLGLAPNAARIAVRFWYAAPLRDIATNISQWFNDLKVIESVEEKEFKGIKKLLSSASPPTRTQPYGDIERLPPSIIQQTFMAAFTGTQIPSLLFQSTLIRIRADQARKNEKGKPVRHVSATRASILKAFLNRKRGTQTTSKQEITVALDRTNVEPAYLWGRMFSVYEHMQEKSAGRDLNRTIRDAYFSAAMLTPRSVYNRLAKLNQIHLRELKRSHPASGYFFDRLLLEIAGKMSSNPSISFPAQSTPEQQACFALGYYHQRQDFFTRRESHSDTPQAATTEPEGAL